MAGCRDKGRLPLPATTTGSLRWGCRSDKGWKNSPTKRGAGRHRIVRQSRHRHIRKPSDLDACRVEGGLGVLPSCIRTKGLSRLPASSPNGCVDGPWQVRRHILWLEDRENVFRPSSQGGFGQTITLKRTRKVCECSSQLVPSSSKRPICEVDLTCLPMQAHTS